MIEISSRLPEGRTGQALAVAAPLCLLLAIIFGLVQPALQWYATRQQKIAEGQDRIAHILALQRILPQLREQAGAAQAASGKTQILLTGASDAIAEANLQSGLSVLATDAGASLTSASALPVQQVGSFRRVGIQVNVTTNWQALTQLLGSIETAQPRMVVDDLSVNSSGASTSPGTISLQASFAVSAFRSGIRP